ncbi:MAG: alpha/beta fold hydrolase [Thermoflexales bacterium]|nr:alpha/beta fold hydrolase [Thermoflexales bacterium]
MHIQLRDCQMEFEDTGGDGCPLLLIHGYPLNHAMWRPQIEGLADVARLIAPDLRGFGGSQATPAPYSMDMLAGDCCALLDALGVTRPVVVCGLSMGGYIAFAFYRRYATRVAGLILTATRATPDSPETRATRLKSAEFVRNSADGVSAMARAMLLSLLSSQSHQARPELVEQTRAMMENASVEGIVGALLGMRERPDSTPLLAQIDKPVLVVHGADDSIVPLAEALAMQAAIKDARLVVSPGAAHLPNLEQPELFNAAVREFLGHSPGVPPSQCPARPRCYAAERASDGQGMHLR